MNLLHLSLVAIQLLLSPLFFTAAGQSLYATKELPNGFRYILKDNNRPANRIYFRLVMAVGSLHEYEGEEGAAHFIEHLAFRETEHFGNGKIVRELEALGGKYGVTINAYTGYDRTVYMFSVPAGDTRALQLGVRIASDWLSHIRINEQLIGAEKPIIVEEIAENHTEDCFDKLKKGDDTRLHRLPLGTTEQLERLTAKTLNEFYTRNYLPQNATLIIAGVGVNSAATDKMIKNSFGHLPKRSCRTTGRQPLSYNRGDNFLACIDNSRKKASVEWIIPIATKPVLTLDELIDDARTRAVVAMLNRHLRQKKSGMRVSKEWYLGGTEHFCFEMEAKTDTTLLSEFAKGIAIVEGVRQRGFSVQEVALRMKSYSERNSRSDFSKTSEQWCDYYTDILLVGWRNAAEVTENNAIAQALSGTTLDEWNEQISRLLSHLSDNPLVGYRFNAEHQRQLAFADIAEAFRSGFDKPDTSSVHIPLIEILPRHIAFDAAFLNKTFDSDPDNVVAVNEYPNLKVREISLKNGAKLILKLCASADSTLSVTLIFRGGLDEIPEERYPFLESAAAYMSLEGIEGVGTEPYNESLANNSLSVINTMEHQWHGIMASGRSNDIRKLTSLIHGRCFSPERCYSDFEEIRAEMKEEREAMKRCVEKSPERAMQKRIGELVNGTGNFSREPAATEIDLLDLDEMAEYYRRIYTRSTELTCIVTGNFDVAQAQEHFAAMLSQYRRDALTPVERKPQADKPNEFEKVADGNQPQRASFHYLHRANCDGGLRQTLILKIAQNLLRNRLITEIRNNAGLIYSPYVDLHYNAIPEANFALDINGAINAENILPVKAKIDSIVLEMQSIAPSVAELEAIKRSFLSAKDEYLSLEATSNWREYLASCVKENISLAEADSYESILHGITPDDVRQMFAQTASSLKRKFLYIGKN